MGIFSGPEEQARKEGLKNMEDKREAFAQALDKQGFKPDTMLFTSMPDGGYAAVCRFDGRQWVIVSPGFGHDGDFRIESAGRLDVRREDVLVKSEGMGGMLGFGKKGERGAEYVVTLSDGAAARLPFVFGRTMWGEFPYKKNPLLSTRRRRKDANVVWELKPIDNSNLDRVLELADGYFGIRDTGR